MPEPQRPSDRTPAQRQADHAASPACRRRWCRRSSQKLNGTGLGEVEVREGDWRIRVRRPVTAAPRAAPRPLASGRD